ncbi:gluconokinase [Danxiaibacter flavus]|uniref:Gluconokinase n=1 Tax=Danxiaibacter flavus TaxID=3049108 RepID=A0ABV3Z8P1_9BACT|nr:gluconokinase [Chitinophagaceae bacterium DXS]
MQHILAIDIGTTHCKAIITDIKGAIVSASQRPCVSITTLPGQHEQDPVLMFDNVAGLMQEAFSSLKNKSLTCVSFSCAMHGLMAVDADGIPLTNIITWADTRSNQYAEQLLANNNAFEIYRDTGTPIHAMSPLCKIMWLKNEHAEVFNKTHKFISFKEYIFYQLFGKFIIDYSLASATGLFNIREKKWNETSLSYAGISSAQLSSPVQVTHTEKSMLPEMVEKLGINNGTPFVIGGSDGCLANLGCGAIHPNELALTIGTSGAIRLVTPTPYTFEINTVFNYLLTDKLYVVGGPTNNGGNVLQWFIEHVMKKKPDSGSFDEVLALAAGVSAGADGLLFLPYLYGERAPIWNATARGCFIGLNASHTIEHMARAVVEGICLGLFDIFNSMQGLKESVDVIYASGGFTRSTFWLQMIADVFGKRVVLNDVADASAMGAAMVGMVSAGILKDVEEGKAMVKEGEVYMADPCKHKKYLKAYAIYHRLYNKLKTEMEALNDAD